MSRPPCSHNPVRPDTCTTCRDWESKPGYRDTVERLRAGAVEAYAKFGNEAGESPVTVVVTDTPGPGQQLRHLQPSGRGVGTELEKMFASWGAPSCPLCKAWINFMDWIGVDGCRDPDNRAKILDHLKSQFATLPAFKKLAMGARVAASGYLTPESILDEAIVRAEALA